MKSFCNIWKHWRVHERYSSADFLRRHMQQTCVGAGVMKRSNHDQSSNRNVLDLSRETARLLLDEEKTPFGSFSSFSYGQAKDVIDVFLRENASDAETVNLALDLLERCVGEMAINKDSSQLWWLCKPRFFTRIYSELWKNAVKKGETVIPVNDLIVKVHQMTTILPAFRYNIFIIGTFMDVLIKSEVENPSKAAHLAEELLGIVQEEAAFHSDSPDMQPNAVIYNQVLQAWANSGLPNASEKMGEILERMRKSKFSTPTLVTYSMLLRFFGVRKESKKIEEILRLMQAESLQLDGTCLSPVIFCYCGEGNVEKAEEHLEKMLRLNLRSQNAWKLVAENVENILKAYYTHLQSTTELNQQEARLARAESLFKRVERLLKAQKVPIELHTATMADIYNRCGRPDFAEAIILDGHIEAARLADLLQAFGKNNEVEKAASIFERKLNEQANNLSTSCFNAMLQVWANSRRPDAMDKIIEIVHVMREYARRINANVEPDEVTFMVLLRFLVNSRDVDAIKIARKFLNAVHRDSDNKPNAISYAFAVYGAFEHSGLDILLDLLDKIRMSNFDPTTKTLNCILETYTHVWIQRRRKLIGADLVECMFQHASRAAKAGSAMKIDAESYLTVMTAWIGSEHPESFDRVLKLFKNMQKEGIEPNTAMYKTLILFLSGSKRREHVQAAEIFSWQMQGSHIVLEKELFNVLVTGLLRVGCTDQAAEVLMHSVCQCVRKEHKEVGLDHAMVERVIVGLIKSGNIVRASCMIDEIQKLKVTTGLVKEPSFHTYSVLRNAWAQSNHANKDAEVNKIDAKLSYRNTTSLTESKPATARKNNFLREILWLDH